MWRDLPKIVKKAMKIAFFWVLFLAMVLNPTGNAFLTSLNNQEFFSFHLKDLVQRYAGQEKSNTAHFIATGTYELQKDGPLFGVAQGRNLIVIQVEALQNIMVGRSYEGQEITPVLNGLLDQDSIYFDHYFQQLGSGNTSDAEFATNNGFPGTIQSFTYRLYEDNYFHGLPWILKDNGYDTAAFHGYDKKFWNREAAYPGQGFDRFFNDSDFQSDHLVSLGGNSGISDKAFYDQSIPYLSSLQQPFYAFMITLSSHHPFQIPKQLQELKLLKEDQDTLFGNYLQAVHYTDEAIGQFLEQLEEQGIYENSVIAIYGDHFGLPRTDPNLVDRVSRFIGSEYDMASMMNVPLIIHIPGSDLQETVSVTGGQSDFMPTISSLLGVETLPTLYFGQNLLTAESGFVPEQTFLLKGSFIKDEIVFEMSRDGVFQNSKAWNFITGQQVPLEQYEQDFETSRSIIDQVNFYLEQDVIRKVMVDHLGIAEIQKGVSPGLPYEPIIAVAGAPQLDQKAVNSAAGLTRSYQNGYRYLMIEASDEEGKGKESITYAGLVTWLTAHPDAVAFMKTKPGKMVDAVTWLREEYGEYGPQSKLGKTLERIVPVLENMKDNTKTEYAGFRQILFQPDFSAYSLKEISDFIRLNDPWAIAAPTSKTDSVYRSLLQSSPEHGYLYAYPVEDTIQRESLRLMGVNGSITSTVLTLRQLQQQ